MELEFDGEFAQITRKTKNLLPDTGSLMYCHGKESPNIIFLLGFRWLVVSCLQ